MISDKHKYKKYTRQDVINYYLIYSNAKQKIGCACDFVHEYKPYKAKKVVICRFARN